MDHMNVMKREKDVAAAVLNGCYKYLDIGGWLILQYSREVCTN